MNKLYYQMLTIGTVLAFVACSKWPSSKKQQSKAPKKTSVQQASSPWGSLTNFTNLTSQKPVVYIDRIAKTGQIANTARCLAPP